MLDDEYWREATVLMLAKVRVRTETSSVQIGAWCVVVFAHKAVEMATFFEIYMAHNVPPNM